MHSPPQLINMGIKKNIKVVTTLSLACANILFFCILLYSAHKRPLKWHRLFEQDLLIFSHRINSRSPCVQVCLDPMEMIILLIRLCLFVLLLKLWQQSPTKSTGKMCYFALKPLRLQGREPNR